MKILTTINDYIVLVVAILGGVLTIIEKSSKLKVNPLTGIFRKAIKEETTKVVKPLENEISNIKSDITRLSKEQKEYETSELRKYILSFASRERKNIINTKDEYEEFFRAVDRYEELIKTLKIKNGFVENEVNYVKDKYNNN